jgi:hypothetical protein
LGKKIAQPAWAKRGQPHWRGAGVNAFECFRAAGGASRVVQTSRGVTESSRRKTSVSPNPSTEGAPFTSGPLVSVSTLPSRVAR